MDRQEIKWSLHRMFNGTPENALDAERQLQRKMRETGYDDFEIKMTGDTFLKKICWKMLRWIKDRERRRT